MPTKKRTKRNKYQLLLKAKASHCKGRTTKASLNKKKKAYIDHAVKNGKTKTEATRIANRVVNGSCSKPIGKAKRKTTKRRKKRA